VMLPKHPPKDMPWHLENVRQMRCLRCWAPPPGVAHHLRISREGGTGMKPPDDLVVNLCAKCHDELHKHKGGELAWWLECVSIQKEALRETLCGYARSLVRKA